jgi:hypothetical protein
VVVVMRVCRFVSAVVLPVLAAAFAPLTVHSQVREVVSKEVSVGRSSSSLVLEFVDGGRLDVAFEGGAVLVDDRALGSYEPGGELDAAWRNLLAQAVALDDGPLAAALAEWAPPGSLGGQAAELATRLDRALEDAVRPRTTSLDAARTVSISTGDPSALVRGLIGSAGRLSLVEEALAGLSGDLRVHVDEDVEVAVDQVVPGTLLLIDSRVRIAGRVVGNVVVIGGALELLEGSTVGGEVRLVDATLLDDDGVVAGGVIRVSAGDRDIEAEVRARLRDELREEIRRNLRAELRNATRGDDEGFSLLAPFRAVVRGVGGVIENLVAVFVLALIGAGVIAFGGDKVDVIAEAARRAPGRAAVVGFAGTVLFIPIWVMGFVALLVSIIGIPVAIAWLPLFPLAACAAAVVGYLAVARNAGEWLADSDYPWTHWIRKSNPLVTMVAGLLGLMLLFMAANIISIVPFLGFVRGLLVGVGAIVTLLAAEIGLGAVILTRAGRRREPWSYSSNGVWEAGMNIDVDRRRRRDAMSRTGVLGAAATLLAGAALGGSLSAQEMRTVTMSRQLTSRDEVRVSVEYGAGRFSIRPMDEGLLYRMSLRYDERTHAPVASFSDNRLDLGVESRRGVRMRGDRESGELALELARGVPMRLDLEFGAVRADLDLGGLHLTALELSTGASQSTVDLSELNRGRITTARFEVGAAEFTARRLGNLNAERIEFDAGVGSLTLWLNGEWQRDARLSIDMGLGALELRVPEGLGIQLRKDSFLTSFDSEGLVKRGSTYESLDWASASRKVTIDLDAAFGSVKVVWVR